MRLNRRVPIGTHGGVRGRLPYLSAASYSIALSLLLPESGIVSESQFCFTRNENEIENGEK